MDLGPSSTAGSFLAPGLPEHTWVQPVADARVVPTDGDPAEVAALQHLPPRQRAVLILREILRWQATEVAELLGTTVVSVNSALQRARAALAAADVEETGTRPIDAGQQELLARYVDAFERYDIGSLVALIHEDATFSMPPYPLWLRGPVEVSRWLLGQGAGCQGSRLVATAANGCAAFGSYRPAEAGAHEPFALQVIEVSGGKITGWRNFLYPELFPAFGLPTRLES